MEPLGIFRSAGLLEASKLVTSIERARLHELFDWFNENLPRPRRVRPAMIFWFRPEAGECASRVWEIVHILREHGVPIQTMWTRRPGWVEYSDRYQIGVIPFRDRAFHVRRHG